MFEESRMLTLPLSCLKKAVCLLYHFHVASFRLVSRGSGVGVTVRDISSWDAPAGGCLYVHSLSQQSCHSTSVHRDSDVIR